MCILSGKRFEAFYDRNEDPYQQMDKDGKRELLGMIGKSSVRKILIDLKFCVNGLSNASQSCQVNSGVITYTSQENQRFSVKRNLTFEN
mgnify:CR=1 FL=1